MPNESLMGRGGYSDRGNLLMGGGGGNEMRRIIGKLSF